jgi:hypothetical protein
MAQVVEHLPIKYKSLNSNPNTGKTTKRLSLVGNLNYILRGGSDDQNSA